MSVSFRNTEKKRAVPPIQSCPVFGFRLGSRMLRRWLVTVWGMRYITRTCFPLVSTFRFPYFSNKPTSPFPPSDFPYYTSTYTPTKTEVHEEVTIHTQPSIPTHIMKTTLTTTTTLLTGLAAAVPQGPPGNWQGSNSDSWASWATAHGAPSNVASLQSDFASWTSDAGLSAWPTATSEWASITSANPLPSALSSVASSWNTMTTGAPWGWGPNGGHGGPAGGAPGWAAGNGYGPFGRGDHDGWGPWASASTGDWTRAPGLVGLPAHGALPPPGRRGAAARLPRRALTTTDYDVQVKAASATSDADSAESTSDSDSDSSNTSDSGAKPTGFSFAGSAAGVVGVVAGAILTEYNAERRREELAEENVLAHLQLSRCSVGRKKGNSKLHTHTIIFYDHLLQHSETPKPARSDFLSLSLSLEDFSSVFFPPPMDPDRSGQAPMHVHSLATIPLSPPSKHLALTSPSLSHTHSHSHSHTLAKCDIRKERGSRQILNLGPHDTCFSDSAGCFASSHHPHIYVPKHSLTSQRPKDFSRETHVMKTLRSD
ncbi:hypothetical protein KC355_g74 [Hortaea werneckii]|nr:hypothetical protein KC355_g74 [Hortaea werneckii]